jgi:hypothetical protein
MAVLVKPVIVTSTIVGASMPLARSSSAKMIVYMAEGTGHASAPEHSMPATTRPTINGVIIVREADLPGFHLLLGRTTKWPLRNRRPKHKTWYANMPPPTMAITAEIANQFMGAILRIVTVGRSTCRVPGAQLLLTCLHTLRPSRSDPIQSSVRSASSAHGAAVRSSVQWVRCHGNSARQERLPCPFHRCQISS